MKSRQLLSILALTALAIGASAYAAGPGAGRGGTMGAGTQSRLHNPGTGQATGTPAQARQRTQQGAGPLGQAGDAAAAKAARRGPGQGIHAPGTGLGTVPAAPATATP